ncbi:MAG: hypothetical protein HY925_10800 [Elusimicrobia bacterium]|nr:hypothetical protein [Elusimicrobiota bacterium]
MIHLLALVATLAAAAADTPEQFVKRFREACDKKDKAAVLALFYAEGAGSGAGWNQEVAQDFVELKVVDVTILPPDASRDGRFVRHDASAKQNLPAVKTLRIK